MLKSIGSALALLLALDLFVLSLAILQIMVGSQSGVWSPFWSSQAKIIIGLF